MAVLKKTKVLRPEPPGPPCLRGSFATVHSRIHLPEAGTTVTSQTCEDTGIRLKQQQVGPAKAPRKRPNSGQQISADTTEHSLSGSNTPYHIQSTQLVLSSDSGPGSSEVLSPTSLSCRTTVKALAQLETIDTRRMGPECCIRVQTGAQRYSSTNQCITSCPKHHISFMKVEISALQAKGAITVVGDVNKKGFYSSMFLVPKKDGKLRPVINLRELNRFVKTAHSRWRVCNP